MAKTALRGIARVGDEDMFLPAWWFEPFGLSMRDFLASRDFQALIAHRPAWDIVVWLLSLLGVVISTSGVVIGWRRLMR